VEASKTIVWVASYPKSGNTWVRFLACNLIFGPQETAAALNVLAPDLHELGATPVAPVRKTLMKTHFRFSREMPLATHSSAAVYVVRHPADVMLSNFHYSRRSGVRAQDDERDALDRYIDGFIAAGGDPRWARLGMGTWAENVRSWTRDGAAFPVLRLRYEDLLADPLEGARQLCALLGLARTPVELERAVSGASFERLSQIEAADIGAERVSIFYKPYLRSSIGSGLRFMRAGRAGEAAPILTSEQRLRFDDAFGASMRELGYGQEPEERVLRS
jgi:hypothetical protein